MDPFVPALEELAQALASGEDPEPVLAEIAEEHGLAAHALRNRAVRAFGPLETYRERQAALKQERQRSAVRSDPALAAASFLAEVANLMLDAGIILVVAAAELTQDDLEVIKTAVQPDWIETIWAGDSITTDLSVDLHLPGGAVPEAVDRLKAHLQDKGIIFRPW